MEIRQILWRTPFEGVLFSNEVNIYTPVSKKINFMLPYLCIMSSLKVLKESQVRKLENVHKYRARFLTDRKVITILNLYI